MELFPFIGFVLSLIIIPKRYEVQNGIFWGTLGLLNAITFTSLKHTMVEGYLPFIMLLTNLYIIAHRLQLSITFTPNALNLTLFLGVGGLLSNIFGTTGISMLLIAPLLTLLKKRRYKMHTILFFIFMLGNCGGCLTPLGDPPLMMGFLKGVPFFWPLLNLWQPYGIVYFGILITFFLMDYFFFYERVAPQKFHIHCKGLSYLFLLASVITLSFYKILEPQILIFLWLFLSFQKKINWHPIAHVAQIFLVLFITLIPFENAKFHILHLNPFQVFWTCGLLSAFLDNAPTYLTFFKLTNVHSSVFLKAISMSSVCMGALTYIGNAPNLMIKIIAEDHDIKMPNFLTYLFYASSILLPIFLIVSLIYF